MNDDTNNVLQPPSLISAPLLMKHANTTILNNQVQTPLQGIQPPDKIHQEIQQLQQQQIEQTATQIHFNFGSQQTINASLQGNNGDVTCKTTTSGMPMIEGSGNLLGNDFTQLEDQTGLNSGTVDLRSPQRKQEFNILQSTPQNDATSSSQGVGTSPLMRFVDGATSSSGGGDTLSIGNPRFRGGQAATVKNIRDKRLSDQTQLLDMMQSDSESSPGSPNLTKIELRAGGGTGTHGALAYGGQQNNFFNEDILIQRDVYEKVSKYYPPNPILPKSFLVYDDSPRSGGEYAYIKLLKFRGKDLGKSKFEIEKGVNQIDFPENVSLKSIFQTLPQPSGAIEGGAPEERKTQYGEIVYMRSALDFSVKNHQAGTKRDEVLEENLLDVRRILKNSQTANGAPQQNPKKGIVNLQGVENFYKKKDIFDKTLQFESRFESGNLAAALKVSDTDYHLLLQNDVNTSGHTQWFFFRVQNTKKYSHVRFNILNLSKPDSLFNEGMKVLVYSEKLGEEKDIGWHRSCNRISYYHNGIKKDHQKKGGAAKTLYTLTFTYEFQYDDDTVYFAYCYPYTYSDLLDDLTKIATDPQKSQFCTRRTLCMSLAGNKVEMLTITSKNNMDNMAKRKGVFITSRVHPGESVGSWMMKGAIDFLTDETSEEAEHLRQNFVFKIIPMLNPDGVINGNYRCSLAGCDLNRRWKAPSKVLHPEIYFTKQLLQQFSRERELVVFCDFHGHSRRKNIFMYGCHNAQQPEETRLYPYLMSKLCPFFSFGYSRFGNQKSKEATARIAMFNDIKIPAIYTMESSFCGMDEGPYANYHFSTDNLMQTGRDFCRTLLLFNAISMPSPLATVMLDQIMSLFSYAKQQNDLRDLYSKDSEVEAMSIFTEKIKSLQQAQREITTKRIRKALLQVLRTTHDVGTDGESSSSAGSDRAPSEDNLEPEEMQMVVPNLEQDGGDSTKKASRRKGGKDAERNAGANANATQDMTTSISPMRRKGTAVVDGTPGSGQVKRNATFKSQKGPSSAAPQLKLLKNNSKSNLAKNPIEETSEKKEDDDDKVLLSEEPPLQLSDQQVMVDQDGAITHKKKRKRNVESRDVWTQTDRSDYMLIKYRQKQKLAMQLAKSQKLSKEEQQLYEQALQYHKAQQQQQQQLQMNANSHDQISPVIRAQTNIKQQLTGEQNTTKLLLHQQNLLINPPDIQNTMLNQRLLSGQPHHHYQQQQQQQQQIASQQYLNTAATTSNNPLGSRNLSSAQGGSNKKGNKHGGALGILGVTGKGTSQQQSNMGATTSVGLSQQLNNSKIPPPSSQQMLQQQAINVLPKIQSPSLQTKQRKGASIGQHSLSPQKKGAMQMYTDQTPISNQGAFSDMTSYHSTQRIINPKISFSGTGAPANSFMIENGPSQPNTMLLVVPNQQHISQRVGKQPKSVPHRQPKGNNPLRQSTELNKCMIQPPQIAMHDQQQMSSNTPVLENAYIQKKLLQQMQQQQQLQDQQIPQEYGTLRSNIFNTQQTNNLVQSANQQNLAMIKKMIDGSQWPHQQQLSQSFYNQVQGSSPYQQQSQPQNQTAVPGHRGRKTVSSKNNTGDVNDSFIQSGQPPTVMQGSPFKGMLQQQQISGAQGTSGGGNTPGGVKISIVNVHNQFNIHNNIIINNNGGNGGNNQTGQAFFANQQQQQPQMSKHQYHHMNSAIVPNLQNSTFFTVNNTSNLIGSQSQTASGSSGVNPKQQSQPSNLGTNNATGKRK